MATDEYPGDTDTAVDREDGGGPGFGTTVPGLSDEDCVAMYRMMRCAQEMDEKLVSLQKRGGISTYAPIEGHEAVQVGSLYALDGDTQVFPTYRDNGVMAYRIGLQNVLKQLMGYKEGNAPDDDTFPPTIPIATQLPHAVGWEWASKLQDDDEVALAYFGDGATSEGDFHEGMNFAGVYDAPVVFLCENNQWAISVPQERQTASNTLAQKAEAYGFKGVQVDGTDPIAVYDATRTAIEKARNPDDGELRPTMIEAVCYREGPHTMSDDPTLYRDEDQEHTAPVTAFEQQLRGDSILDDELVETIDNEIDDWLNEALDILENPPKADPYDMFSHVYDEMTPRLQRQYDELRDRPE